MDGVAITAMGAVFTTLVGVFLKFITDLSKSQARRDELYANALRGLTEVGKEQVKASNKVAKATEKSALEAKQRNGHLGEQNVQITQLITGQNKDMAELLTTMKDAAIVLKETNNQAVLDSADVAAALIIAADKVASQPTHIKNQTVDIQTVKTQNT